MNFAKGIVHFQFSIVHSSFNRVALNDAIIMLRVAVNTRERFTSEQTCREKCGHKNIDCRQIAAAELVFTSRAGSQKYFVSCDKRWMYVAAQAAKQVWANAL